MRSPLRAAAFAVTCVLAASVARAETIITNLGQPFDSYLGITYAEWQAQAFTTGPELLHLDQIVLSLFGASDPGDAFFVALYSATEAGTPGRRLATLAPVAPDIQGAAPYAFTTAAPIILNASATYWIVSGVDQHPAQGTYAWAYTASADADPGARPGWSLASDYAYASLDFQGNRLWTRDSSGISPYQVAVRGAPTPAPSAAAPVLLGGNTHLAPSGSAEVTSTRFQAATFTTGASPFQVTRIELPLQVVSENATLHAALFADVNGLPSGAPLALLPPAPGTDLGVGGTVSFIPATAVFLDPAARYWIALRLDAGAGEYRWLYTDASGQNGSGASIGYSFASTDPSGVWLAASGSPFQFGLYGTAIPEVSAAAAVFGLAAFYRVLRRRRPPSSPRVQA